jgi:hypothetical protein
MSPSRSNKRRVFYDNSSLPSSASSRPIPICTLVGTSLRMRTRGVLVLCVNVPPTGIQVHRVASTEARRLRRIPLRNVEHRVVRYYVRTSVFSPYLVSDNALRSNGLPLCLGPPGSDAFTRSDFLPNAKSRLDADQSRPNDGYLSTSLLSVCVR